MFTYSRQIPIVTTLDVLVCGARLAGIGAAVASARTGTVTMCNHDVGWISSIEEPIKPEDLYVPHLGRGGENITKTEFLTVTEMPGRYYSFNVKGYHFIVLDGKTGRGETAVPPGYNGLEGAYWIDDAQKAWLAEDLETNQDMVKIVFCHEVLHHTPVEGTN